ncbi:MAG TPA: serine/threonine-protein kinase, partial [Polyangiaceae bacterium]|nr:serine/threonine-protein kinase [Polyangiaceae bacterium]
MRAESVEKWSRGQLVPGTPYEILGLIGVGGMGTVYEVLHRELGRRFVLKLLHERLAARSDLGSRMKNEWTALAGLSHPNIVQVTDAGYAPGGLPYYVMEKLEGSTVGQLLRERGRLSVGLAARITLDVLSGLAAAHERGVIHRDIKPQNVFVLLDGRAKVLDFGIAQMSAQAARVVTAAGVAVGTPRYMAPEQAEGRRVDGRADIYAVALVLYEMLLGRGPFAEIRDPNQLVMAHIARTPERIERLAPELPVEL